MTPDGFISCIDDVDGTKRKNSFQRRLEVKPERASKPIGTRGNHCFEKTFL
jgi:hypothetical protein